MRDKSYDQGQVSSVHRWTLQPVLILACAPVVIAPLRNYSHSGTKHYELRNATPILSVPPALIN